MVSGLGFVWYSVHPFSAALHNVQGNHLRRTKQLVLRVAVSGQRLTEPIHLSDALDGGAIDVQFLVSKCHADSLRCLEARRAELEEARFTRATPRANRLFADPRRMARRAVQPGAEGRVRPYSDARANRLRYSRNEGLPLPDNPDGHSD